MMNGLGSSDASFAPASMAAASFYELGGSRKEQLWDSDSAACLRSHLFCHQDPTLGDMSTGGLRFFPQVEYPYPPLGLVQIGLNLGQRTYFSSSSSGGGGGGGGGEWSPSHQQSRSQCQAEGCKSDLSGAKHYHRRHKVCDFHSKAAVVITHGLQQRFCQQCSRFHVLAEFDEAKRSCRKRLADHNRRRRKPRTKQDADCSTSMITPSKQLASLAGTSGMTGQGDHLKDEAAVSQRRRRQQQQCFSSAPNEASMSMGGGASSHLHLDQSMFGLDFI